MATPLLVYGAQIIFECIDPTTGAAVTGVTITNPVVSGVNLSTEQAPAPAIPPASPLWVPLPAADQ